VHLEGRIWGPRFDCLRWPGLPTHKPHILIYTRGQWTEIQKGLQLTINKNPKQNSAPFHLPSLDNSWRHLTLKGEVLLCTHPFLLVKANYINKRISQVGLKCRCTSTIAPNVDLPCYVRRACIFFLLDPSSPLSSMYIPPPKPRTCNEAVVWSFLNV
jgi:hypothetical protein